MLRCVQMKLAALALVTVACWHFASADSVPSRPPSSSAMATAERACKAGDAKACTHAGGMHLELHYDRVRGGHDAEAARVLYQRGCDLGDVQGCTGIGWLLVEVSDYTPGLKILEDAAGAVTSQPAR